MHNWDDVRVFLAVSRHKCITDAAKSLGINHTTVSRRISGLEGALKAKLIERVPSGTTLTLSGQSFLLHAERMEKETMQAEHLFHSTDGTVSGKIRLATREAFGAWLVCPQIYLLKRRYPKLEVELISEASNINLINRDADIVVSLHYPSQSRLIVQKLTDYRLGLFASRDYLRENGLVETVNDLRNHNVICYVDDLINMNEQRYLQSIVDIGRKGFCSTNILAQYAAMACGMGIGIIPVYHASQDPNLVQILPNDVEEIRTYWLSVHPETQNLPNVRAVIQFLKGVMLEKKSLF